MNSAQRHSVLCTALIVFLAYAVISESGYAQVRAQTTARTVRTVVVKPFATQGTFEFGGSVGFSRIEPVVSDKAQKNVTTAFYTEPYIGYFVIDGLELGINPLGFRYSSTPAIGATPATTETEIATFFAPAYNFRLQGGRVFPYVEGLLGYTYAQTKAGSTTTTRSGVSYGGGAGAKFVVARQGLVKLGLEYVMITLNPSGASKRSGTNELWALVGFSIWLN